MAIIFDLDQTLINSQAAEFNRRSRRWAEVYDMIPSLTPYEGIPEMLKELNRRGIPYGVVTSSPSSYCSRVIKQWNWNLQFTVCYHDTQMRKPHPEPINLAVTKLGKPKELVIAIGDHPNDTLAAKAAGVVSVGVLWGAQDPQSLINSKPDYLFNTVDELSNFIRSSTS